MKTLTVDVIPYGSLNQHQHHSCEEDIMILDIRRPYNLLALIHKYSHVQCGNAGGYL